MIKVTDSAFRRLHALVAENPEYRDKGLRIFVERGGCAGMQYGMQFDHPKQGDHRIQEGGVGIQEGGVEVLVDAESANHLVGSTVDFTDGLSGVGFKISNPNAVRSCGCGTSFEVSREA